MIKNNNAFVTNNISLITRETNILIGIKTAQVLKTEWNKRLCAFDKQQGESPLLVTKFQACSCITAGFRAI